MITTEILNVAFVPRPWGKVVDLVCQAWEGTKYKEGACSRGRAVDCVHFMGAILDALCGWPRVNTLRSFRGDISLHDRRGVIHAARAILRTYPEQQRVDKSWIEPGDVIVTGPAEGGPGHVMVVGGIRGRLWHATIGSGVCQSGYGISNFERLFAVFRANDKERWSC